MPKYKTEFKLDTFDKKLEGGKLRIIGEAPNHQPYVTIELPNEGGALYIKDDELQMLSINIQRALKSKFLHSSFKK